MIDTGIMAGDPDFSDHVNTTLSRSYSPNTLYENTEAALTSEDPYLHGPIVSGIIGAIGNNNYHGAGVNWGGISMISLRVDGPRGGVPANDIHGYLVPYEEDLAAVISAIKYATSQNIPILNFSGGFNYESPELSKVVKNYNGLFICASGNSNIDIDGVQKIYPASYEHPNMITVSASSPNDQKADFSNYSKTKVHLFAPGQTIRHPIGDINGVDKVDGTSFAAPIVTGVAALMKAVNPLLTATQIKNLILETADRVASLKDYCITGGRINAFKAVEAAIPTYRNYNINVGFGAVAELSKGESQWFKINVSPGTHTFETTGNLNTRGFLYSSLDKTNLLASGNFGGNGNNFRFNCSFSSGGTVYLFVRNMGNSTGNYKLLVSSDRVILDMLLNETYDGAVGTYDPILWYRFEVPVTAKYNFRSKNSSLNVSASLYDDNFSFLVEDINYDPNHFLVSKVLSQGETVYLKIYQNYSHSDGEFIVTVDNDRTAIQLETPILGIVSSANPHNWYKFYAPESGKYSFVSEGNAINSIARLYNEKDQVISEDINGSPINFTIESYLVKNQLVYLQISQYNNEDTGQWQYTFKVTRNTKNYSIDPNEYGFEGQYYFEEKSETLLKSDYFWTDTNRLRCGYIYDSSTQNSYLALSANRKGAGTAFLEYSFDYDIKSVSFGMALWSSSENITDQSADILFQYKDDDGEWVTLDDISISDISKSKDDLDQFTYVFNFKVNTFRIYVSTTNTGGSNNKGRVVLGEMNCSLYN